MISELQYSLLLRKDMSVDVTHLAACFGILFLSVDTNNLLPLQPTPWLSGLNRNEAVSYKVPGQDSCQR